MTVSESRLYLASCGGEGDQSGCWGWRASKPFLQAHVPASVCTVGCCSCRPPAHTCTGHRTVMALRGK